MSATASPEPNQRGLFLAHHPLQVGLALLVVDVGTRLPGVPSAVDLAGGIACISLLVAWTTSDVLHLRRRLCLRCARATPLDPQAAVAKKMRWLRLYHYTTERPWLWAGTLIVLVAPIYVFGLKWLSPLVWIPAVGLPVLAWVHMPLQPWCPFCHWDDGGDEEPSPEPTPDPSIAPDRDKVR